MFGGIEAGGTKFVCAVGTGPDDLRAVTRFATTTPEETLARAIAFFKEHGDTLRAVGIASFGPVDPDPASPTFGFIKSTPKPGWSDVDVAGPVRAALGVPVGFDTDVNGAAQGEARWGAARGLDTFVYLTVGTGIGGGGLVNGRRMHGLLHPEMGHLLLRRAPNDTFPGSCPFHGDCLEGMASGPALEARWKAPAATLPEGHEAWTFEAHYLAHALVHYILTLSPRRLLLGGGVMEQAHLFPRIRDQVRRMLNGYLRAPEILQDIDRYIVPPALGNRAGVLGALALAHEAT